MIPTNTISSRPVLLLGEKVTDPLAGGAATVVAIAFFLDLRLIQIPDSLGSDHERRTRTQQ